MHNKTPQSWYKQFWPWFLLAPLVVTVIVGITMLTFSIQEFDGTVNDNYYKEGLAINQVLQRDKRAEQLGMAATVKVDNLTGDVLVSLEGDLQSWPEALVMQFINPTRASRDYEITLTKVSGNHYRGQLEKAPLNFWYLEVSDTMSDEWRIKGSAEFPVEGAFKMNAGQLN